MLIKSVKLTDFVDFDTENVPASILLMLKAPLAVKQDLLKLRELPEKVRLVYQAGRYERIWIYMGALEVGCVEIYLDITGKQWAIELVNDLVELSKNPSLYLSFQED